MFGCRIFECRTRFVVGRVGKACANSCTVLHDHVVPGRRQLGHQIWGRRDTVFTGRVFSIDAYFQGVCGLSGNGGEEFRILW